MTACQHCAACCVNGQLILVRPDDQVPHMMIVGYRMRMLAGRCVALTGRVGKDAACSIYEQRPEICRVFAPGSWACREVRQACGLFSDPWRAVS